mmetsp:Transcript_5239/g.14382  ORF Transcript_5239/g.14382 Transcript_5239/m.14382 type:complete len:213 (-) Transcript_5239:259-897(-)
MRTAAHMDIWAARAADMASTDVGVPLPKPAERFRGVPTPTHTRCCGGTCEARGAPLLWPVEAGMLAEVTGAAADVAAAAACVGRLESAPVLSEPRPPEPSADGAWGSDAIRGRTAGGNAAPEERLRLIAHGGGGGKPARARASIASAAAVCAPGGTPTSGARGKLPAEGFHVREVRVWRMASVMPIHLKAGLRLSSCTFSMRCTEESTFAMS